MNNRTGPVENQVKKKCFTAETKTFVFMDWVAYSWSRYDCISPATKELHVWCLCCTLSTHLAPQINLRIFWLRQKCKKVLTVKSCRSFGEESIETLSRSFRKKDFSENFGQLSDLSFSGSEELRSAQRADRGNAKYRNQGPLNFCFCRQLK